MAAPSFAKASDGSLTGITAIKVREAAISKVWLGVPNTTGSGDGLNAKHTPHNLYYYRAEIGGWYMTNLAGNVHAKLGAVAAPTITNFGALGSARISRATIVKQRQLYNVTAAGDNSGGTHPMVTYWEQGLKVMWGEISGFLQDDEQPLEDENQSGADPLTQALTLPVSASTSVAGKVVFPRVSNLTDFRGAGPNQYILPFRYTEAVTVTGTPFADESYTASLNLDNGQTMAGTLKIEQMRMLLNYDQGALVPVRLTGNFHDLVTFS